MVGSIPPQIQGALATAVVGFVAWLARELYYQRNKSRDQVAETAQEEALQNEDDLESLLDEVHRVEDEMVESDERLRERIDQKVSDLRTEINEQFVSRSEFNQLREHIDQRFDDMNSRLGGIEESIRNLAGTITDAIKS